MTDVQELFRFTGPQPGNRAGGADSMHKPAPGTFEPVPANERLALLDVLRGVALLGIVLMNIEWFSRPVQELGLGMAPDAAGADRALGWLVYVFVQGKFWPLFALLFGVGFALMAERAQAAGRPFVAPYLRRTVLLFLMGLLHATLLWPGDILHNYALAALPLLLLLRSAPTALLPAWAVILYTLPWLLMLTYALAPADPAALASPAALAAAAEHAGQSQAAAAIYASGSWSEVTTQRWHDLVWLLGAEPATLVTALAFFAMGAWLWRTGRLRDVTAHRNFHRTLACVALPLGAALAVASARISTAVGYPYPDAREMVAQLLMWPANALLMLGYVGALILALGHARVSRWAGRWLAPAGRMALTNYLLQSAVASTVFYGYGLGLWGQLSRADQLLMAFALFTAQCLASHAWLQRFQHGPFEWCWRAATYLRMPPLRVNVAGGR